MDSLRVYLEKYYNRYMELIADTHLDKYMTAYYQGKLDYIIGLCQHFNIKGICDNVD